MYRIMLVRSHRDDYKDLYMYLTTTIDGVTKPAEYETVSALDKQVEFMLNKQGYSKADFMVIEVVDYSIDAKDYKNEGEDSDGKGNDGDDGDGDGDCSCNCGDVASREEVEDMLDDVFGKS